MATVCILLFTLGSGMVTSSPFRSPLYGTLSICYVQHIQNAQIEERKTYFQSHFRYENKLHRATLDITILPVHA